MAGFPTQTVFTAGPRMMANRQALAGLASTPSLLWLVLMFDFARGAGLFLLGGPTGRMLFRFQAQHLHFQPFKCVRAEYSREGEGACAQRLLSFQNSGNFI
jgi:hypothetical protein